MIEVVDSEYTDMILLADTEVSMSAKKGEGKKEVRKPGEKYPRNMEIPEACKKGNETGRSDKKVTLPKIRSGIDWGPNQTCMESGTPNPSYPQSVMMILKCLHLRPSNIGLALPDASTRTHTVGLITSLTFNPCMGKSRVREQCTCTSQRRAGLFPRLSRKCHPVTI